MKQRRFYIAKHGMITFSLGKRFPTKARASHYAKSKRSSGYSARVVKTTDGYSVYTRRER